MGSVAGLSAATTALTPVSAHAATSRFGFEAVSVSTKDTVVVPKGYNWHVATRWGDPLFSDIPEFDHATRGTAASQAGAFGDNNDGMAIFTDQDGHQILIANNEYTNRSVMWGNNPDGKYATVDDINKGKNAHGLTAVELKEIDGRWQIVKDSRLNRRFTPDEPMEITGPARGHALMKTNADSQGVTVLGTFNNCGNGRTPWGTYLACEENFNGYFGTAEPCLLGCNIRVSGESRAGQMVVIKPRDLPLLRSAAMMAPRLDDGAGLRRLSEGTNGRVLAKPVVRPHTFSNGFSNLILALRSLKIAVFSGHAAPSHPG